MKQSTRLVSRLLALCLASGAVSAADDVAQRAEALKNRVIELNRSLYKLEQDTLAPVDTQVVVFVAVDEGAGFDLDSVELRLDDRLATQYLYSDQERQALLKGGVQRLYVAALPEGTHQIQAVFSGRGAGDSYLRKVEQFRFTKGGGATLLELRVARNAANPKLPRFVVREVR